MFQLSSHIIMRVYTFLYEMTENYTSESWQDMLTGAG